jgi:putative PIN family toxin of toxin-antitoxin system
LRVVLDTGVVVSALLFPRGRLAWLRDSWTDGRILPLVSRATVDELVRVLAYPKFDLDGDEIEAVLAAYLPFTESVVSVSGSHDRLPRCDDPADQEFLSLAQAGHGEALATGDDDLLRLCDRAPFPVLTPAQLKSRLS